MSSDPISTWEQRTLTAGVRMAGLGWTMHVTQQLEMPSGEVAWTGTLAHHDRIAATVEQRGDGGGPLIRWGLGAGVHPLVALDSGLHRDVWARDLTTAGTDEEEALSGLDQVDVTSAQPQGSRSGVTCGDPAEVTISLTFRVHDRHQLLAHAQQTVADHGNGHELDPGDLGDAIAEVLLHPNPGVDHLDHGIELVGQDHITEVPSGGVIIVRPGQGAAVGDALVADAHRLAGETPATPPSGGRSQQHRAR